MNPERLKLLEQYALEDPNDPFNKYALGLEWMKSDSARARSIFNELLERFPEYIPTYYHAAILEINDQNTRRAKAIIVAGIGKAMGANDLKAAGELRFLMDDFD